MMAATASVPVWPALVKYDSYAGGAYRTGTGGHCVRFQGLIWKSSNSGSAISSFKHCS